MPFPKSDVNQPSARLSVPAAQGLKYLTKKKFLHFIFIAIIMIVRPIKIFQNTFTSYILCNDSDY